MLVKEPYGAGTMNKENAVEGMKVLTTQGKMVLGGTGVTWWAWLGENHEAVSALCAIIGTGITLVGFGWAVIRYLRQKD